jgi:hypothetical protein
MYPDEVFSFFFLVKKNSGSKIYAWEVEKRRQDSFTQNQHDEKRRIRSEAEAHHFTKQSKTHTGMKGLKPLAKTT